MRGNNFKEKKVVPLIFTQFWIRSHLNQLDRLTPQDVYITTCSFDFDISGSSLQCTVSLFFPISNYNLVSDCTPPKILQRRLLYLAEMSRSICSWRIFVFSITLVQLFWSCWASFVNKIRFSLIPSILASNLPTIFNLCCSSFTNRLTNVDDVFKGTFFVRRYLCFLSYLQAV